MRYGIIDIGSNTIRTVVYEVEGTDFSQLISEKDFSEIISYVQGKVLVSAGVEKLVSVLTERVKLCRLVECSQIFCFATASLRNVENQKEVTEKLQEETGIEVRLLSGEEEAHYDFLGLKCEISGQDGVGLDLGGGSCQIFSFRGEKVETNASLKIGSLVMYNRYVEGILPTCEEMQDIRNHVKNKLKKLPELKKLEFPTLYAMGGSARAAAKLHRALTGNNMPAAEYKITLQQMEELCNIESDLGVNGIRLIGKVVPERLNTLIPGLVVLKTICKYVGASQIQIVKNGVREGYLWENILKR